MAREWAKGSGGSGGSSYQWHLSGPASLGVHNAAVDRWLQEMRPRLTVIARGIKREAQAGYSGTRFEPTFSYRTELTPYRAEVKLEQPHPLFPYVEFPTKPHVIRAKNKPYLVFKLPDGRWVRVKQVNHPGTKGRHVVDPIFARYEPQFRAAIEQSTRAAANA